MSGWLSVHTQHFGGGPFTYFYGLDCQVAGTRTYAASIGCTDSTEPPIGNDKSIHFEEITPVRPLTFKAELLDPPDAAGNVLVSYEFHRTMRGPSITVPGGEAHFVSNGGPGSFIVNLSPGAHRLVAFWCFGGSNGEQSATATIEVPDAALPIRFELDDASPPDDRKILIARHRADKSYISSAQTADARVRIRAYMGVAGRRVYFRTVDPPDTASYVPVAERRANDNRGGRGQLTLPDALTDASGWATTELQITDRYAGDNYRVEGSSNPTFSCDGTCASTGVITAWKRVFLEKKRMFRAGAPIVGDAPAGSVTVTVDVPKGVKFRAGDEIRLLHAPLLDGSGPREFYSEPAIIAKGGIAKVSGCNRCRELTLVAPLKHDYSPDLSFDDVPLADGVGLPSEGYYELNEEYLHQTFAETFVEFLDVPQVLSEIPFVPRIYERLHFANKWFENSPLTTIAGTRPGDPNVKHVLAGSIPVDIAGTPNAGLLGEVSSTLHSAFAFPNSCWTFVGHIEELAGTNGLPDNPEKVVGENYVHELAHTFSVNYLHHAPSSIGHCDMKMATDPALACSMNYASNKADGRTGFHWVSSNDSEYMTIRYQQDPVPAP